MTTALSLRERLLGSWQLLLCEQRRPDGTVATLFGAQPNGLLIYSAGGHVAVQISRSDRASFAAPIGTPEEMVRAWKSYLAYYGTYTVDEAAATVTHHVEGSIFPNNVGTDEIRAIELQGDELTLYVQNTLAAGERVGTVLVWRSAPSATAPLVAGEVANTGSGVAHQAPA
jgi:hypothetical protein